MQRVSADSPLADGREQALPGAAALRAAAAAVVVVGAVLLMVLLDGRAAG